MKFSHGVYKLKLYHLDNGMIDLLLIAEKKKKLLFPDVRVKCSGTTFPKVMV